MRIASMILGLMLSAWVFFEAFLLSMVSGNDDQRGAMAGGGLIAALVGGLGAALVVAFPLASVFLFGIASMVGYISAAGGYDNHYVYATIYLILCVMAFFGWRGKKKETAEKSSEALRQRERDDRMEQLLVQAQRSSGSQCPSCGQINPTGTRFCGSCGTQMVVALSNQGTLPKIAANNADPKAFFDGISKNG